MKRLERGAIALAAFAGASAWLSFGTLAVTNPQHGRIGALPSWWTLVVLVLVAIAGAWAARLRTADTWPLSLTALLWTPWLPKVPAALLIFQGPVEGVVWLVAVGGVLVAILGTAWRRPAWWTDQQRAPTIVAVFFFVCSIGAGAALGAYLPGGDEPHYLVITQSLLYDGDLKIENNHARGDFFDYIETPIRPDFLQRGKDGQIYSVHAPGVSALVLPAFAIGGYPGALMLVSLLSAVAAAAFWRVAYRLSADAGAAWAATLAVGFSATYFLHSFTIFPDPVGAVLVTAAVVVLVGLETAPETIRAKHLVTAGCCLALLPWLHTRFALVAAMFGLVFVLRLLRQAGLLVAFAGVPILSAAGWFAFFWAIYGTLNPAAPYGTGRQNALEWIPAGLAGLSFDQQFGLLANTPVLAFAFFGVAALWRAHRRLAIELVAIAVPYVITVASFGMWWGGWSAPARFLACLIPLAIPPLAAAWARSSPASRSLFAALTLVGMINVASRLIFERGALVYNLRDGFDLLLDWSSRTINLPLAFPSIHRLGTEPTLLLGSIWLVAAGTAIVFLQLVFSRRLPSLGSRWALTSWIVAACALMAMTASWRASRTQPLTVESSVLEFLRQWQPGKRPIAIRLPSFALTDSGRAPAEIELRSSSRARDLGDERPLLALTRIPGGEYVVVIEGPRELEGTLTVSVGPTSQMVEQWSLDGMHPGDTVLRLRLPVQVQSLVIRGDDRAKAVVRHLGLRPAGVVARDDSDARYALRGARYGATRAFFLDDAMYVEPQGVWTRGNSSSEFVLSKDDGGDVQLDVTAGPVHATLEFVGSETRPALTLAAGERRRIQVPTGRWTVITKGVFRPKDYDPASHDARPLGVRLEFP
jgi:hypothetical protein